MALAVATDSAIHPLRDRQPRPDVAGVGSWIDQSTPDEMADRRHPAAPALGRVDRRHLPVLWREHRPVRVELRLRDGWLAWGHAVRVSAASTIARPPRRPT